MSLRAVLFMVSLCGVVWGGFLFCLFKSFSAGPPPPEDDLPRSLFAPKPEEE